MSHFNMPPGCDSSTPSSGRLPGISEEELLELFAKAWSYGFDEPQIVALWQETIKAEESRADSFEEPA